MHRLAIACILLALSGCSEEESPDATASGALDLGVPVHDAAVPDARMRDAMVVPRDASVVQHDATLDAGLTCDVEESLAQYTRYIEPILTDDQPSSCNGCHLPGIDLESLVQETPCATMACFLDRGLVNFDDPEESTLLSWIERGREAPEEAMVPPEVVAAEYEGFRAWIEYSASCHATACADVGEHPCGGPAPDGGVDLDAGLDAGAPDADPCPVGDCGEPEDMYVGPDFGLCDDEGLLGSFRAQVMRWRGRCEHCHVEGGLLADVGNPPMWLIFAEEGGGDAASAEATLASILEAGYVDIERPEYSLLLLKPLKIEAGGLLHGGGTKFLSQEDPAYLDVRAWVERYASCQGWEPLDAGLDEGVEEPEFDAEF
ncbi:MAG: hypothetical protein ACE366_02385 [Bradymonadia bacterium]